MLTIRPATLDDAEVLYGWRTDPLTQANSRTSDGFTLAAHIGWLEATLKNPERLLLVGEIDGVRVGTVRVDRHDGTSELSWTVAPAWRGRGIGKDLVAAAARIAEPPLYAEVKEGNAASLRIAAAVGLVEMKRQNGIVFLRSR